MRSGLVRLGWVLAVGISVAGCGGTVPPRSAAEIAAEASFLGTLPPTAAASAAASTDPASTGITMAVLGDGFTTGSAAGGQGSKNWTSIVAAHFGWTAAPVAAVGAGFLERRGGPGTFGERVPAVVATHPGVVLVWGASNDLNANQASLRSAVVSTLTALHDQLPSAQVVLIGPALTTKNATAAVTTVDATEKAAAAQVGIPYVDELTEAWLTSAGLTSASGAYPTDAGHAAIAQHVISDLTTLGVADKAVASPTSVTPTTTASTQSP